MNVIDVWWTLRQRCSATGVIRKRFSALNVKRVQSFSFPIFSNQHNGFSCKSFFPTFPFRFPLGVMGSIKWDFIACLKPPTTLVTRSTVNCWSCIVITVGRAKLHAIVRQPIVLIIKKKGTWLRTIQILAHNVIWTFIQRYVDVMNVMNVRWMLFWCFVPAGWNNIKIKGKCSIFFTCVFP